MIQSVPRCFLCSERIEHDPVFAPPTCDHEEHSSAVFHGICLMEWRERRDAILKVLHERLGNAEAHGPFGYIFREGEEE